MENQKEHGYSGEDLFNTYFKVIPDLFFLMDSDGFILDYRAQQGSALYAPPEMFLNKRAADVLPPDVSVLLLKHAELALREAGVQRFDYDIGIQDGLRHYECRISRMGETQALLAVVRDITDEYLASKEIVASELRFRSLLENAPYIVFITDMEKGLLLYCNKRAKAKFECGVINYTGKTVEKIFTNPREWQKILRILRKEGVISERETPMTGSDGAVFWAVLSASVVEYQNKPAVMISLRDISLRKKAEYDLEIEKIRLRERIKEQKGLQSVLSITGDYSSSVEELLKQLVEVIGSGWMYPDIAEVQIELNGKSYKTQGFKNTPWSMTAESRGLSGDTIKITVVYREERPREDMGPFLSEERTLLENITVRIANVIDRSRYIESIQEHEQLMQIMFKHITESVILIDPQTSGFILFNDLAAASLGYSTEEFSKLTVFDINANLSRDEIEAVNREVSGGNALSFEAEHSHKNGETRHVSISLTPLTFGGRGLICETSRDITEEKIRALEKQKITDNLMLFSRLLGEISSMEAGVNGDIDQFARNVTELLGERLSLEYISIWRLSEDKTRLLNIDYYIADQKTHASAEPIDLSVYPVVDLIFRTERFTAIDQNFGDPIVRDLTNHYMEERGVKSFLQCGIISSGQPVGTINISYKRQQHQWHNDESTFFCQVADQIGMAFINRSRIDAVNALKMSETFLNRAQKVSKTGHWYHNFRKNEQLCSEELYRMLGLQPGTPLDFNRFLDYIHPDDRERVAQEYAAAKDIRAPYGSVPRLVVGGEIYWVALLVEFDLDHEGNPVSLGTVQDITEPYNNLMELENYRNHLEELVALRTEELQAAKTEADNANQAKSMFLSNMSHEIRTPMNAIMGYAHLMKTDGLTPKQSEQLDKLSEAAQNLLNIINDILDISKIEAHKIQLDIHDFELARVIDNACAIIAELASGKNLNMLVDLDGIPQMLRGDGSRFGQILLNLLSNAVKFTEKGGVTLKGRIINRKGTSIFLRFEIIDTGIGIDSRNIARLFHAFEQADDSTTRRYGGTGLGLAISKQLTELMGGRIGVESTLGKGSTFWVELPFEVGGKIPESAHLELLQGEKAVVIDDSPEAREILSKMLSSFGLSVDVAASGREALEKLRKSFDPEDAYKLIIVDYKMPDMDGIETVLKMKSMNLRQPPNIIMVTAYSDQLPSKDMAEAGISRVLTKPVTPSRLNDALTELLSKDGSDQHITAAEPYKKEIKKRLGAHVLIVEDNEINQDVTAELLKAAGIRTSIAVNGKMAVKMVRETSFDLVLMDVQMPVMDGLQATRAIRKIRGMESLPIIAMTANAFQEDRLKCIEAGMNDHVAKPIKPESLYSALIQWLPESAGLSEEAEAPGTVPENHEERSNVPEHAILADVKAAGGVNVEEGLEILQGDRAHYVSLLHHFTESHGNDAIRLSEQMKSGDWNAVSHTAHALKGVAGTLRAVRIQKLAEELEFLAQNNGKRNRMREIISDLSTELIRLAQVMGSMPPQHGRRATVLVTAGDKADAEKILGQMKMLLQDNDSAVNDLMEESRDLLFRVCGGNTDILDRQIQEYDYQEALESLERIQNLQ
jgi:PAS domain S-box-containing protein